MGVARSLKLITLAPYSPFQNTVNRALSIACRRGAFGGLLSLVGLVVLGADPPASSTLPPLPPAPAPRVQYPPRIEAPFFLARPDAPPASPAFQSPFTNRNFQPFLTNRTVGVTPAQTFPQPVQPAQPPQPGQPLAWDAATKEYSAKLGELMAHFTFRVTNVSPAEVVINSVRTSCGCTLAKIPGQPWKLPSGTNGEMEVTVDLRGKSGVLTKMITVDSTAGMQALTIKVSIPAQVTVNPMDRTKNQQMALADRQAVFRGDCATCHLQPTLGKQGHDLYVAACGICHDAEHRATMVPDLAHLKHPTDSDYWRKWITSGKPGSLMPAFAQAEGGPLGESQIISLVEYLSKKHPSAPASAASGSSN